jgi:hypothetical protein
MKRALLYVGSWISSLFIPTVFAVAAGLVVSNCGGFGRLP